MNIVASDRLLAALSLSVVVAACAAPPRSTSMPTSPAATPARWEPAFFERSLGAVHDAYARGDVATAERGCAAAIGYVGREALAGLRDYAAALEARQPKSGDDMRAKARRLEQLQAEQACATQAGSTYLGFAPWIELDGYAKLLADLGRAEESASIGRLAAAYRRGQEIQIRRTLLIGEGKDPRGTC